MTTQTTEKWPIKMTEDLYEKKILKAGRYKARLVRIKPFTAPVYKKPDEIEDRLLFIFEPIEVALKEGESAGISLSVRPSNSIKSKMFKLLCSMSESGNLDDSIRCNDEKYQAFAESMIGKAFQVTSEPSKNGRHNNATSVTWMEQPNEVSTRGRNEVSTGGRNEVSKPEVEEPDLVDAPPAVCGYNIAPLVSDKIKYEKAKKYLADAGAKEIFKNQWESPVEIKALQNYKTIVDDIPF